MKLFFSPGACSFAPHMVMHELGLKHDAEKVDLRAKTWAGGDYKKVSPLGYVPALQTDSGDTFTEVAAILQYLVDQKPEAKLAPAVGTMERYHFNQWLTFVSSEMHKGFGPIWNTEAPQITKDQALARLKTRFDFLNTHLEKNQFLMGAQFTAPDAYLYTVMNWTGYHKIDLSPWPNLKAYVGRISDRPSVHAARKMESGEKH
jgi:glutathione S-transferase